eukprot:Gb_34823 [translate_table: standard]
MPFECTMYYLVEFVLGFPRPIIYLTDQFESKTSSALSVFSSDETTSVLFTIAALYYLCTPLTKTEILTPQVLEAMRKYEDARLVNIRLSNLAKAFMDKHVNN